MKIFKLLIIIGLFASCQDNSFRSDGPGEGDNNLNAANGNPGDNNNNGFDPNGDDPNEPNNSGNPGGTPTTNNGTGVTVTSGILEGSCDVGSGGIIDFESLPDGSAPRALMSISDQYFDKYGISFSLLNGGHPVLADVGGDYHAFPCEAGKCASKKTYDTVIPAHQARVGKFFLTDKGHVDENPLTLVITYKYPTKEASGDLLDVDGQEEWTIKGYDKSGAVIASTKVTNDGMKTDGHAQTWQLRAPTDKLFAKIVLSPNFVGGNFGLGFDRFSPGKICP